MTTGGGPDAAVGRAGAEGGRSVTVLGGGDLLIHPPVWKQARADGGGEFDFRPMFDGIAPAVAGADLALCHLEVPLAGKKGPFSGWPAFKAPPQLLDGVERAGYDGCSTASNHVLDYGEKGVRRTLAAFDRAGLGAAGSARSAAEAAAPQVYRVRPDRGAPVEVAHLSSTVTFNGMERPPGKKWLANLADPEAIRAEARAAKDAGAEIVVLSMHWGTEYDHGVDDRQRELAAALTGSPDIDVILGHHAHVVQPVEKVRGTWVVYGMGNQLARHAAPVDANREGAMARVTFTETASGRWRAEGLEMLPTRVDIEPKVRLVDLATALRDPRTPRRLRDDYAEAHARITGHLTAHGAPADGAVVAPAD
ncbi:CapA family protein [Murinocardiopsis flavida]|nr:CapA family protein [Murinocardiopsis flavida]